MKTPIVMKKESDLSPLSYLSRLLLAYTLTCAALAHGKDIEEVVPKGSSIFRIDREFGGNFCDCEKSSLNKNDDYLCWAAASSNMLAWSGWGNKRSADKIFRYYQSHWTDDPKGSVREALRWWFNGENRSNGGARVKKKGGAFWKHVPFPESKWKSSRGALFRGIGSKLLARNKYELRDVLREGYAVGLQLVNNHDEEDEDRHVITLWGYTYDDRNEFSGILVSDSDDSKKNRSAQTAKNLLRYHDVHYRDGKWFFLHQDKDWQILAAYALLQKKIYVSQQKI